jgi:hypothetical protein
VNHDPKEVKDMQEKAREFNPRPLLIALATIFAVAAIWAATALAAGGSSPSSGPAASNGPFPVDVQQNNNGDAAAPGDCPDHGNGSGDSSGGSSDSSGTSSSDF